MSGAHRRSVKRFGSATPPAPGVAERAAAQWSILEWR